jgi:hypothetical protein
MFEESNVLCCKLLDISLHLDQIRNHCNMHRPVRQETNELTTLEPASPEESTDGVSLAFPEGGREGWTCLLGSCLLMFPSFGFQTAGKPLTSRHLASANSS